MRKRKNFNAKTSLPFNKQIKKLNQFKKSAASKQSTPSISALEPQQQNKTELLSTTKTDCSDLITQCDIAVAESKAFVDEMFSRYFGRKAVEQIALWESINDVDLLTVRRELKMAELSYNLAKAKRIEIGGKGGENALRQKQGDFVVRNE